MGAKAKAKTVGETAGIVALVQPRATAGMVALPQPRATAGIVALAQPRAMVGLAVKADLMAATKAMERWRKQWTHGHGTVQVNGVVTKVLAGVLMAVPVPCG